MMKCKALSSTVVAIAMMCLSGTASALAISDTSSFGFGSLEFYDKENRYNDPVEVRSRQQGLTLNGFDSALGMLTGVSIAFESDWSLQARVAARDNNDAWFGKDYTNGHASAESHFYIDMLSPNAPVSASMSQQTASCSGSGWSGASCTDNSQRTGAFDGLLNLSSLSLTDFLDTVLTFNLTNVLKAEAETSDYDTWVYAYNKNNGWQGSVTVTYNYEEYAAVAEPSAVALLGIGLLGLAILRHRNRTRRV